MTRSIRLESSSSVRRVVGLLVVVGLLALRPVPAVAAGEEEAKLHFNKAQIAYKLGRYKEAIRGYEAAYRAMPAAAFLFNIAQSHRQQYRLDKQAYHLQKALSLYKSYLREIPKAPNRRTVQQLIDDLKSLLSDVADNQPVEQGRRARLLLRGDQAAGAQVVLDGKLVGTIPHTQEVTPGVHQIKVTMAGFAPWSTSVQVLAGTKHDLQVLLLAEEGGPSTEPTPVYKKWWFWTIIGAAVAAGAGTGIYFATRGDDVPAMPTVDLR